MSRPADGLRDVEKKYETRAGLDPLRSVLDAGDPDNLKNEFVDFLERRSLARALGAGRYSRALDLGCGVGRFFGLLATRCDRVVGLDATQALLKLAASRIPSPSFSLARGSALEIPLRDASISLVLSVGVLIHAVEPQDLERVAREVARVLQPGGLFVALEHMAPESTVKREGIVYRSVADFGRPFVDAGLRIESSVAVRKVPSRIVHWVRTRRLPRALWSVGAALEARLATRGRAAPDYRDHLFVMRRSAGTI